MLLLHTTLVNNVKLKVTTDLDMQCSKLFLSTIKHFLNVYTTNYKIERATM